MRYQLTIELSNGEKLVRSVEGEDPDDAIAKGPKIVHELLKSYPTDTTYRIRKCRPAERGGACV